MKFVRGPLTSFSIGAGAMGYIVAAGCVPLMSSAWDERGELTGMARQAQAAPGVARDLGDAAAQASRIAELVPGGSAAAAWLARADDVLDEFEDDYKARLRALDANPSSKQLDYLTAAGLSIASALGGGVVGRRSAQHANGKGSNGH